MVMRRRRAWADELYTGDVMANNGEIRRDLLVGLSAADTKTSVRIIGDLTFYGVPTLETEFHAAVHVVIGVASREAFDLGTLPDADNQADYPTQGWLYAATRLCMQSASGGGLWREQPRFQFDLRASRKIDRGVLYLTTLNKGITGSAAIEVVGRVRTLCLT